MEIVKRTARRGVPNQCQAGGCRRSAGYDMILLGTEHTLLCGICVKAMSEAYDNALRGWPDEPAHALAEAYRAGVAA
jgi:hypothetical protein